MNCYCRSSGKTDSRTCNGVKLLYHGYSGGGGAVAAAIRRQRWAKRLAAFLDLVYCKTPSPPPPPPPPPIHQDTNIHVCRLTTASSTRVRTHAQLVSARGGATYGRRRLRLLLLRRRRRRRRGGSCGCNAQNHRCRRRRRCRRLAKIKQPLYLFSRSSTHSGVSGCAIPSIICSTLILRLADLVSKAFIIQESLCLL